MLHSARPDFKISLWQARDEEHATAVQVGVRVFGCVPRCFALSQATNPIIQ